MKIINSLCIYFLLISVNLLSCVAQTPRERCEEFAKQTRLYYENSRGEASGTNNIIIVDKQGMQLFVVNDNFTDTLLCVPIGLGKNKGDKIRIGDNRTPEGTFTIQSIEKSAHWIHDFHDGFGPRKGAYGNWFIRLNVPDFHGIGIHGTCFPESIGTRCSEGCIRLKNDDLEKLVKHCHTEMVVIINNDN